MKLTENDRRVLDGVEEMSTQYDGYIPHGTADWTAIRRLSAAGLVEYFADGACADCDALPIYKLTAAGEAVLAGGAVE